MTIKVTRGNIVVSENLTDDLWLGTLSDDEIDTLRDMQLPTGPEEMDKWARQIMATLDLEVE